jgi:hypothetical protein
LLVNASVPEEFLISEPSRYSFRDPTSPLRAYDPITRSWTDDAITLKAYAGAKNSRPGDKRTLDALRRRHAAGPEK